MGPLLLGLDVADPPDAWRAAGFAVHDGLVLVGEVVIRLAGSDGGIRGVAVEGVPPGTVLDGMPVVDAAPRPSEGAHPNGVEELDHLVVMSPDRARTLTALAAVGLEPRRTRDVDLGGRAHQQTFFRMGAPILELVTPEVPAGDAPASLWGLAFTVADVDALALRLGDSLGAVRPAVQPGRRIVSLRHRDVGVSVPVAFLDRAGRQPNPG